MPLTRPAGCDGADRRYPERMRTFVRVGVLGVLVMVASMAGGCRSSVAPPTLRVAQVLVGDRTADGLVLYFDVDAENRNDVELPLREAQYAVRLDGREVFRGTRSPEASLRRLGVQRVRLPAVMALGAGEPAPTGPTRFEIEGALRYQRPGPFAAVLYDNHLYRPSVPLRDAGVIDIPRQ